MVNCSIVKLTSPYLNVVIIIGGIFFYFDVILFGIDEGVASFSTVNGLCQVLTINITTQFSFSETLWGFSISCKYFVTFLYY